MNIIQRRVGTAITLIAIAGVVAWQLFGNNDTHPNSDVGGAKSERKVLYWYDPMRPDQHFDAPGPSPFMDMQLVPKFADDVVQEVARVKVDPQMVQNLGMRTALVVRGSPASRIEASGRIEADERSVREVAVRAAGWVEVLHVRAEGDPVRLGQVLAEVYSPAIEAAQRELLLASDTKETALVEAARAKLVSLGVSDADVAGIERNRRTTRRISIRAPMHGYVMSLSTREGAGVDPQTPLFELVGHDPLWVIINLPESQSASVPVGGAVEVRAAAHPGRTFAGVVDYLYPDLDAATRTRRARIVLDNLDDALHPGHRG